MPVVESLRDAFGRKREVMLPDDVKAAIDRGRTECRKDADKRRLCAKFERGEQYDFLTKQGIIASQSTVQFDVAEKPLHRIRNKHNMIRPLVEDKVSTATSRIPGYEVVPSTSDPEDRSAAGVSQKVARYGYDQWRMRKARMKVVKSAIAQGGDGFAMPVFNPNVGPYENVGSDESPEWRGRGEVQILTFGGNSVFWEPGTDFDLSPWYVIERAELIAKIQDLPGFFGPPLKSDVKGSDAGTTNTDKLVLVSDFMERPCPDWPEGRRILVANNRVIVDNRLIDPTTSNPFEHYPLCDSKGRVLDEPCIHRLSWTIDPETDRDLGLVWQLIDAQRTINDCINKLLEWKNRCLNPQMKAVLGSLVDQPNDMPGWVNYYRPGFPEPQWEKPPQIPGELFQIVSMMREAMQFMASYADTQVGPNVAAAAVQAADQQAQSRWDSFLGDLAEFDSRLMRHSLLLVSRYYDTPRLIQINGWFGADRVEDFTGAQLNGQVDVTVLPGSLQSLSQNQMLQRIQFVQQNWPGWLSPEAALAALDGGAAQTLVRGYELDVARIDQIIASIRDGTIMEYPTREEVDPMTGMPLTDENGLPLQVPFFMPMADVDNLTIWKQRLGDWMKTPDYQRVPEFARDMAQKILAAVNQLQAREAQQQALMQQATAAQMGMANAVKAPGPASQPSAPNPAT